MQDVNSGAVYAAKQFESNEFLKEGAILEKISLISHFGIPRFIDYFIYDQNLYLIQEMASGCSLSSLLKVCKGRTDYVPVVPLDLMKSILR